MKNKKRYLGYHFVRIVFGFLFYLVFHPIISGEENISPTGGAVLAGNHRNAVDPAIVAVSTNRVLRFMAKKELHEGIFGPFFRVMATIPVNRSIKDHNIINTSEMILRSGQLISLFPEGTRNRSSQILLPFKFGAAAMAKRSGVPIIPFAITGRYIPLKRTIKITFGKPIDISNMEVPEATELLREQIKKLIIEETGRR